MLTTITTLALLTGGGAPPARQPASAATSTVVTTTLNSPIISVPLQTGQNCPQDAVACLSGEPTLSLTQIRSLAKVFGANLRTAKPSKTSPDTLNLEFPDSRVGIYGIGLPPMFTLKGESYYSASSILGFLGQNSPSAYYTASPRLQLHTGRATLDMGNLPPDKVKLFFAGLAFSATEALLSETFRSSTPCEKCDSPGVTSITWSALPPTRLQTNLAPGEVVMLVTYDPKNTLKVPYVTATGIVGAGGWVDFPVERRPARMVTDVAQLRPDPLNEGNSLLLRVTHTPLGDLAEGIVPLGGK